MCHPERSRGISVYRQLPAPPAKAGGVFLCRRAVSAARGAFFLPPCLPLLRRRRLPVCLCRAASVCPSASVAPPPLFARLLLLRRLRLPVSLCRAASVCPSASAAPLLFARLPLSPRRLCLPACSCRGRQFFPADFCQRVETCKKMWYSVLVAGAGCQLSTLSVRFFNFSPRANFHGKAFDISRLI